MHSTNESKWPIENLVFWQGHDVFQKLRDYRCLWDWIVNTDTDFDYLIQD